MAGQWTNVKPHGNFMHENMLLTIETFFESLNSTDTKHNLNFLPTEKN